MQYMHRLVFVLGLLASCVRAADAPARPDPNGFSHIYLIVPRDEAYLRSELASMMRAEGLQQLVRPESPFTESQLLCQLDVDWGDPVTVHIWITDMDGLTVHDGRGACGYSNAGSVKTAGLEALKTAVAAFCVAYQAYDPSKVYPKRSTQVKAELEEMRRAVEEWMENFNRTNRPPSAAHPPKAIRL